MLTHIHIRFALNQKDDNAAILAELKSALKLVKNGPVFIIGSWQTGDFGHVYAAAVRHFSIDAVTPFSILVLQAEGFGVGGLLKDIEFSVRSVSERQNGTLTLLHTDAISKNRAIAAMTELMKTVENAREPFDATFWAKTAVQSMTQGQPLTPVWADLVRGGSSTHYDAYTAICTSFMQEYIDRFGVSKGRERFVCLWGRTSGMPKPGRLLGGANPQYDSSESGNQQLCLNLKFKIPSIKAILIVGDGFNHETRQLKHVFNLGEFWKRQSSVMGRFQENGFFDYMTAFYDCDVVHLGMKSGGMDVLGIWGQKVVFIDSLRSPEVTKARVGAWTTKNLLPVPISEMPTSMGKAIETARAKNPKSFKTTFSREKDVQAMEKIAHEEKLDDLFNNEDLGKIASAVSQMFG